MRALHVPCCLLSVPCPLCDTAVGERCKASCVDPATCTCGRYGDACCERHYAEVSA